MWSGVVRVLSGVFSILVFVDVFTLSIIEAIR